MPTSNFQPIRLLDLNCCYNFTYFMANSADPDQLASSEANWSGSTLFAKAGYILAQQDKGWLFVCWVILHAFWSSVDFFFFQNWFFQNLSGIPSQCQTVWIQIRPDVLIWVLTVCKGYQQMTKVATSGERVKLLALANLPQRHQAVHPLLWPQWGRPGLHYLHRPWGFISLGSTIFCS